MVPLLSCRMSHVYNSFMVILVYWKTRLCLRIMETDKGHSVYLQRKEKSITSERSRNEKYDYSLIQTDWLTVVFTDNQTITHTYISVFMIRHVLQHCIRYKTRKKLWFNCIMWVHLRQRGRCYNLTSRSLSEWARLSRLAGPDGLRTEERPLVRAQNKDPWEEINQS